MDRAAILTLNNAHAAETSLLTAERLDALIAAAFHLGLVDGGRTAFLLGFDQDAEYDSPNFRWFQERYRRFAYVDRIVAARRGQGHGRTLYAAFAHDAKQAGHDLICCEVNVAPPNPASDAFHAAMGFAEIGRAERAGGKVVRYLVRAL